MSLRRITEQDLINKTITKVDASAINALTLTFSDGQTLEIEADVGVQCAAGFAVWLL